MSTSKSLAVSLLGGIQEGKLSIAALMESVGVKSRNVRFNTSLHRACERYRDETGCQVVERNGELIVLDRDKAQLHDGIIKARQAHRKSARSIRIVRAVDVAKLETVDQRRRDRFLDREEARAASATLTMVQLTQEQIQALAEVQRVVKRERRPRSA